ncbi:hypothetical protein I553_9733 [Mycobacterium xenopi 4042]|uniref:Uncharacterized protein n=1 Tax=Mycobacterium xenopi 4042 TaxID=1299334 RepID=X7YN89_MYCXE|nr:hypothetical protein I553_9733 [Mycobacterium xenopi 4042]
MAGASCRRECASGLKFSSALPPELARVTLAARIGDQKRAAEVLGDARIVVR